MGHSLCPWVRDLNLPALYSDLPGIYTKWYIYGNIQSHWLSYQVTKIQQLTDQADRPVLSVAAFIVKDRLLIVENLNIHKLHVKYAWTIISCHWKITLKELGNKVKVWDEKYYLCLIWKILLIFC